MPSRNELTIMGHLGRDAEVKADGRLLSFSVACSEKWQDKRSGEWKESTTWVPVKWWSDKFAAVMASQLKKGALVAVFGAFATEQYEKDGQKKTNTYCKARLVVPCSWPKDGANQQPSSQTAGGGFDDAEYGGGADDGQFPF